MTATEHVYRSALENRVLERLRLGPLTSAELIRDLGVSYNGLYPTLSRLQAEGSITATDARLRGHKGKGSHVYVYALTEAA